MDFGFFLCFVYYILTYWPPERLIGSSSIYIDLEVIWELWECSGSSGSDLGALGVIWERSRISGNDLEDRPMKIAGRF